jgi:DNA polymerase-1
MPGALDDVTLHLVSNLDELWACARWAGERRDGPLFADTESSGLNPHHDRMRMVQLGDTRHGWAFPKGWWGAAIELLTRYAGAIGFHNSPYDWRVLKIHENVTPLWHKTEDTLLLGHIADSLRLAGLKPRATQEVDPRALRGEQVLSEGMKARHWTFDDVPDTWGPYWMYAALDPVLAAHLWAAPSFTRARTTYREAYDLERATARICAGMMLTGMRLDLPFIHDRIAEIEDYTGRASNWLRAEFDIRNPGSTQQVVASMEAAGIPVEVFTEKGNPSLNKEALGYYGLAYPQHKALFDAVRWTRKGNSMVNNYLGKFLTLANDDILHYNIHSCRARTTRMSITDPAMQTFDRDVPAIRGSYIPRPGHALITIDADQIEARLTAHFANDPRMIADFRYADENHLKFFIEMASRIYAERITKRDPRYTWTKNATYGQIYGAGLAKAAVTAGVPVEVMRPAYEGLSLMYPNVGYYMNHLIRTGKGQRPKVQTIDGRWLYVNRGHEYALLNTQIQANAAIILKRGIIGLDAGGLGEFLRLPVHDEILMEAPVDLAAEVLREAERILTDHESFRVPITWSGSILTERWVKT